MLKDKNSSNFTKNSYLLIAFTAFLLILYILSFTKSCSINEGDKREKVKTSLVNQKYKDSINYITLQDARGSLELKLYKGFWTLQRLSDYTASNIEEEISLPLSQERIESFFKELTKVRNLYKISDNITQTSSLGLSNGTEFHITYSIKDTEGKENFHELIFGNQDFSLSSRYMMTGENPRVYEIDDSLDAYLTTSIQSWAEPYIISRIISDTKDIQNIKAFNYEADESVKSYKITDTNRLLELRHGGLPSPEEFISLEHQSPVCRIEIENGNKSSEEVIIFKSDNQEENTYLVKTVYKDGLGKIFYTASSKISSWTYNMIIETML